MSHPAIWAAVVLGFAAVRLVVAARAAPASAGSDEHFHVYCIKKIRWNRHRFFHESPEIALPALHYPILFHWLMSFLPLGWLRRRGRVVGVAVDALNDGLSYFIVAAFVGPVPAGQFALLAVLVVFSPNALNLDNARNAGLSARGFGGVFATGALLFLWLFHLQRGAGVFLAATGLWALVILSSLMAIQAVAFGAVLLAAATADPAPLLALPAGALVAQLVSGGYAGKILRSKMRHLVIYSRYLAEVFILRARPSIWGDFLALPRVLRDKGARSAAAYYWTSPLLRFLLDFPLNGLLLVVLVATAWPPRLEASFLAPALLAPVLFLATSLRRTRFLGEPERYSEYVQVFCLLWLSHQRLATGWLLAALAVAAARTAGNTFLGLANLRTLSARTPPPVLQDQVRPGDVVAANHWDMTKSLLGNLPSDRCYSVFYAGYAAEYAHGIHFPDLFEVYPELKDDALVELCERTGATVCLIKDVDRKRPLLDRLAARGFRETWRDGPFAALRRPDQGR